MSRTNCTDFDGRISELCIDTSYDSFGLYDKINQNVLFDKMLDGNQISFFNLAAIQTWLDYGRIFLSDNDLMLKGTNGINALLK